MDGALRDGSVFAFFFAMLASPVGAGGCPPRPPAPRTPDCARKNAGTPALPFDGAGVPAWGVGRGRSADAGRKNGAGRGGVVAQHVTLTPARHDQRRVEVAVDLQAQMTDVNVDDVGRGLVLVAVEVRPDAGAADDLAAVTGKECQQGV